MGESGRKQPSRWIEEVALVNPSLLPWEQWEHCLALVKQDTLFEIEDGEFIIPDRPGLGIEIDEKAIDEYRVS